MSAEIPATQVQLAVVVERGDQDSSPRKYRENFLSKSQGYSSHADRRGELAPHVTSQRPSFDPDEPHLCKVRAQDIVEGRANKRSAVFGLQQDNAPEGCGEIQP